MGGGAGWNKKGGNAKVPPPLGLEIPVLWGPTQHQTPVLLLLHTLHPRYCNSPTASHTSLAWTVGPGLPLRKPRPHLWVVFIIPCMSYLMLWVIRCRTSSNVKYNTLDLFTFCSILIEDQLKRNKILHVHTGTFLYIYRCPFIDAPFAS